MPPPKDDKPSVRTYADHEVITPPNKLIKVIAKRRGDDGDELLPGVLVAHPGDVGERGAVGRGRVGHGTSP